MSVLIAMDECVSYLFAGSFRITDWYRRVFACQSRVTDASSGWMGQKKGMLTSAESMRSTLLGRGAREEVPWSAAAASMCFTWRFWSHVHCERACGVKQRTRGIDARKQRQRGDREAAADEDRDEDGDGERHRDGFRRLSCSWRASSSSSVLWDFFGAPT